MKLLRWWLAVVFFVSGLTLLWAPLVYPDDAGFWVLRLDPAILIGVGLLCATYALVGRKLVSRPRRARIPAEPTPESFRRRLLVSMADGFLVFSVASFVFNMIYMLFNSFTLHPAIDTLHLLPTLYLANAFWEKVICRSSDPIILWLSTVVLMDGVVGMFCGLVLSPVRLVLKSRVVLAVISLVAFVALVVGIMAWNSASADEGKISGGSMLQLERVELVEVSS